MIDVDVKVGAWVRILAGPYRGSRGRIVEVARDGALVAIHRLYGSTAGIEPLHLRRGDFRIGPPPGGRRVAG
jgi:ribosomal protein L24